jgi:vitamin B12 transporter
MTEIKNSGNCFKYLMLFVLPIIYGQAAGQDLFREDTIRIKEVVISSRPVTSDFPGFKKTDIDTAILKNYNHISLGELLTVSSQLFIKSYGSGGSATSSIRGTGASHTQVSWNGINISNPMLGQTDFSLINSGMIDNVQVSIGGASLDIGCGGIGGIINLENKPSWTKKTQFSVNPGIGSFGKYYLLAGLKTGNDRFQSVTRTDFKYSENNFPYLNTEIASEPVWDTWKNSQVLNKDFLQEFYFKKNNDTYSARLWYQAADRNLPGSMLILSGAAGEKQYDESLRSMLSCYSDRKKADYFVTAAWLYNRLDYVNPQASIQSQNQSNSFVVKGGFETKVLKGTTLKILLNNELDIIKSNNYRNKAVGNIATMTAMVQRRAGNRFASTLLLSETIDNNKLLIPDFSAGIEFRMFPAQDHFIRSGIARTSRIPSMNDRYWNPGGNENLRNEYAYMYDLAYKISHRISPFIYISAELGCFRNLVRDMVQWHPGEYSYWIADNLKRVNTSGFESAFSFIYSQNSLSLKLNAGYTYIKAVSGSTETEPATDSQLMYIPKNQANGSMILEYRNFYSVFITSFTGRRYITVDNSGFLPAYSVSNIVFGTRIPVGNTLFDFNLRIENIFNISYQTIAYYPQPGRSYNLSLLFQLNKKINK